jgi:hypothetical protein
MEKALKKIMLAARYYSKPPTVKNFPDYEKGKMEGRGEGLLMALKILKDEMATST